MPLAPPTPRIHFRLRYELERVARHLRSIRLNRQSTIVWSTVAAIAAFLLLVQQHAPALAHLAAPVLLVTFILAAVTATWLVWRERTNLHDAARYIGRRHPELRTILLTAVEQHALPSGEFHFLQQRVIDAALRHAGTHPWRELPRRLARIFFATHVVAAFAALGISFLVILAHRPAPPRPAIASATSLEITPGNTEIERHSALIVTARFPHDSVPREATLVWQPTDAAPQRALMHRSLSDPIFAFTLSSIATDTAYHIEYDDTRSATFALTVFDLPALLRADASLDYPDYTNLPDRRIVDTRRISAVVGTALDYEFAMNKPLARATLRSTAADDLREIPLEPASADRTRFRLSTTLARSDRFTLHLEDDAGRTNPSRIEVRIEALENRRPELKLTFPSRDLRVSPLEELSLEAEARDDFGLRDYGLGIGIADAAPVYHSLAPSPATPRLSPLASPPVILGVEATLRHLVALEDHHVKPNQLVTWFAWADDIGPDGNTRRTTSDLFFAEVRALEEIFREDATGGGRNQPGGGGGGPGEELIETQRQITIAIWKLRQQDPASPAFATDAATLRDSQAATLQQLAATRERLEEPTAIAAADEAAPLMEQAREALEKTAAELNLDSLDAAWTAARGAYQSLLRMQSRDTNVSQSRGGGGGGGTHGRDQLNQLEFRNEEDRYETESQAQPPPTAEEREQLQVLARLRELARRQEDFNRRLQELQTALAAAEDEAAREAIRRELKRLEDEQRRMLSELDETRQRVDRLEPGQQTQQTREQLDQTREDMRRSSEQLAEGEVSQALAAGTRARENLQRTSEDLRREAAGRFGEQMREARRQARELNTRQQEANRELEELGQGGQSLDDSAQREALAETLQEQAARREALLETLRQVAEDSEGSEPRLHRQVYDLLRQQNQSNTGRELAAGAELLRRGFIDPVRERQAPVARDLEQLQRAVERAAGAVLGDETSELRFAQRELDDLTRQLRRDRGEPADGESAEGQASTRNPSADNEQTPGQATTPGDSEETEPPRLAAAGEREASPSPVESESTVMQPRPDGSSPAESPSTASNTDTPSSSPSNSRQRSSGTPSSSSSSASSQSSAGGTSSPDSGDANPGPADAERESLAQFARDFGQGGRADDAARGPISGNGFADWADRLRTVEELMESPEVRQQLAGARFRAEELRRENQRHGQAPQWNLVEMGIVAPLEDARAWLRQELSRRENPDALQPVDRDPVPDRYAEAVKKYYESLGSD